MTTIMNRMAAKYRNQIAAAVQTVRFNRFRRDKTHRYAIRPSSRTGADKT